MTDVAVVLALVGQSWFGPTGTVDINNGIIDTKFMFSGHMEAQGRDEIWGSFCDNTHCTNLEKIIPHMGNDPSTGLPFYFDYLRNPKVITKPAFGPYPQYYILYFEGWLDGVPLLCASTSFDGHVWSKPDPILRNLTDPAAVVVDNRVFVYANKPDPNSTPYQVRYDLGESGIVYESEVRVAYNVSYQIRNVDVKPGHMIAEVVEAGKTRADTFTSEDGILWSLDKQNVLAFPLGTADTRTPAHLGDTGIIVYANRFNLINGYDIRTRY